MSQGEREEGVARFGRGSLPGFMGRLSGVMFLGDRLWVQVLLHDFALGFMYVIEGSCPCVDVVLTAFYHIGIMENTLSGVALWVALLCGIFCVSAL